MLKMVFVDFTLKISMKTVYAAVFFGEGGGGGVGGKGRGRGGLQNVLLVNVSSSND